MCMDSSWGEDIEQILGGLWGQKQEGLGCGGEIEGVNVGRDSWNWEALREGNLVQWTLVRIPIVREYEV